MMDFLSVTFAFLPWILKYWSLSPSTFDLTSCPSINISSLLFWQMPVEKQWNITRLGFVCVYLVPLHSGMAGCNQCCPSTLLNGLRVMMCRCQTRCVWAQGSLILDLFAPHDLMLLGLCLQEASTQRKPVPAQPAINANTHYKTAGALT